MSEQLTGRALDRAIAEALGYQVGVIPSNSTYVEIQLTQGYSAKVDSCDADLAEFKWQAKVKKSGAVYAIRTVSLPSGKRTPQYLHRVVLERVLGRELLAGEYVDHADHDGKNNRRDNLRLATNSQNGCNTALRGMNTSGFKGVHWHKSKQKWQAQIRDNGKKKSLGYFSTPEDAYAAYCTAAKEIHGAFACIEKRDDEMTTLTQEAAARALLAALTATADR